MGIFNQIYDYKLLQKYSIAFGSLFDGFYIVRRDNNNVEQERYRIPISHSNKEKFVQRIMSDTDLLRKEGITLPRFAFERVNLTYNSQRKLSSKRILGITDLNSANTKIATPNPVAYDLTFNLYLATKTLGEAEQIIEQILPAFTPDYVFSMKTFDNISNFHMDIPVSLVENQLQDSYEGDISEKRTIIWTLTFVMNGFLFGVMKNKPIIKQIDYDIQDISQEFVPEIDQQTLATIHIEPVVEGKLLSEIYETDDWDVSVVFGGM